jgi:sugar phosphate isomerase/epimerase
MLSRRDALKVSLASTLAAAMARPALALPTLAGDTRDDSAAEKLGFMLGTQAWTFRDRSAFEALDIAKALGLKYIEFYPGQPLSAKAQDAKTGYDLTAAQIADLKGYAKQAGITPMAFGVIGPARDEKDIRRHFTFAKEMGIGVITCEPAADAWDLVDKVATEMSMKAACHNHPKRDNYRYWNPDYVLESIKGRSAAVGCCADIGHWTRSKIVAVEALKKYEGKIISLHLKDIREVKGEMIDQPWGTGTTDVAAVLRELRSQKFAGYMSVEYEHGAGKELEENVRKSIQHFDGLCREILAGESKPATAPTKPK